MSKSDCYSNYDAHSQLCTDCELIQYCSNAQYPAAMRHSRNVDLSTVDCYSNVTDSIIDYNSHAQSSPFSYIFTEMLNFATKDEQYLDNIFKLIDSLKVLYCYNKRTFRIVLIKILNPEKSYEKIAQDECCDKQLIDYHLKRALQLVPVLSSAILIDKRRLHKK